MRARDTWSHCLWSRAARLKCTHRASCFPLAFSDLARSITSCLRNVASHTGLGLPTSMNSEYSSPKNAHRLAGSKQFLIKALFSNESKLYQVDTYNYHSMFQMEKENSTICVHTPRKRILSFLFVSSSACKFLENTSYFETRRRL